MSTRPDIVRKVALFTFVGAELLQPLPPTEAQRNVQPLAISDRYHPSAEVTNFQRHLREAQAMTFPAPTVVFKDSKRSGTNTVSLGRYPAEDSFRLITTLPGGEHPMVKTGAALPINGLAEGSVIAVSPKDPNTVVITGDDLDRPYPGVLTVSRDGGRTVDHTVRFGFQSPIGEAVINPKGDKVTIVQLHHNLADGQRMTIYDLSEKKTREVPVHGLPSGEVIEHFSALGENSDGTSRNFGLGKLGYAEMIHYQDRIETKHYPVLQGTDHMIWEIAGPNGQPAALTRNQWVESPAETNAELSMYFERFGTLIVMQQGELVEYHQPKAALYPFNPAHQNVIEIVDQEIDQEKKVVVAITKLNNNATFLELIDLRDNNKNVLLSNQSAPKDMKDLVLTERNGQRYIQVTSGSEFYEAKISTDLRQVGAFVKLATARFESFIPTAPR